MSPGSLGNSGSSDYTDYAWVTGVGLGATITPAKGDTDKTLFFPNAGLRNTGTYTTGGHGTNIYCWLSTTYPPGSSNANCLYFSDVYPSGIVGGTKSMLYAHSLRCVRS